MLFKYHLLLLLKHGYIINKKTNVNLRSVTFEEMSPESLPQLPRDLLFCQQEYLQHRIFTTRTYQRTQMSSCSFNFLGNSHFHVRVSLPIQPSTSQGHSPTCSHPDICSHPCLVIFGYYKDNICKLEKMLHFFSFSKMYGFWYVMYWVGVGAMKIEKTA